MNIYFDKCSHAQNYAIENKSFGIFYSEKSNLNSNIHTHECCEILYCKSGGKFFLIDDKVYKANDGDIFVINQFEAHKITSDCDVFERYVVQLHPEFLFSVSTGETDLSKCFYIRNEDTSHRLCLNEEEREEVEKIFSELKKDYKFGADIMHHSIMLRLLILLNRKFLTSHTNGSKINNKPLKNAIIYINEHLADELSLDIIAKNSYISVNQLCRLFKSNLGTTVTKYIIGKRISQAKKYLKNGSSVSDTAFMCGFRDYSNFIRTFTGCVGISPGKYKKNV